MCYIFEKHGIQGYRIWHSRVSNVKYTITKIHKYENTKRLKDPTLHLHYIYIYKLTARPVVLSNATFWTVHIYMAATWLADFFWFSLNFQEILKLPILLTSAYLFLPSFWGWSGFLTTKHIAVPYLSAIALLK